MKPNFESEFKFLIKDLNSLKHIKASKELKHRLFRELLPTLPFKNNFFVFPFYAFKPLLFALIFFLVLGSSVIFASQKSQPGDLLYPVKTAVNGLFTKTKIEIPENNTQITPSISFSPTPTKGTVPERGLSPIKTVSPQIKVEIDASGLIQIPANTLKISPTPTKTVLPTIHSLSVTPSASLENQANPTPLKSNLPVNLNLNIADIHIGI